MNAPGILATRASRRLTPRRARLLLLFGVGLLMTSVALTSSLPSIVALAFIAEAETQTEKSSPAGLSEHASLRVTGTHALEINLSDGRAVLTAYTGDEVLRPAFERNEARPLALASADFDEDGTPDLVGGYDVGGGGAIALYRGNADAIYPNSPEAQKRKAENAFTDAPFLSPARVFAVAGAPDFVGAGDFDADGHWDVVTATRGANVLRWLAGDGRGGFKETGEVRLPGGVTALVAGEVNRADGLTDVVVGVAGVGVGGFEMLVFESPGGALTAQPEAFELRAEATSLTVGQLDDKYEWDLAAAAGRELLIVRGRDRKLSQDAGRQAEVRAAQTERQTFSEAIKSIAIGKFGGRDAKYDEIAALTADGVVQVLVREQGKKSVATMEQAFVWRRETISPGRWAQAAQLMTVNVTGSAGDDLAVVGGTSDQLHLLTGEAKRLSDASKEGLRIAAKGKSLRRLNREATLNMGSMVAAMLPMRLDADALSDLVSLGDDRSAPTFRLTSVRAEDGGNVADAGHVFPTSSGNVSAWSGGAPVATTRRHEFEANAKLSDGMMPSGGCPLRTPINFGQTVNGTLETTDCFFQPGGTRGGSYFDAYTFNGLAGQRIAVGMSSSSFDTYLYLQAPNGSFIAEDDDGGAGTNSRIPPDGGFFTLPANGTYTILATSFNPSVTGSYALELLVESAGGCPVIPIRVGQTVNEALSTTDCIFQPGSPRAGSRVDTYTFDGAVNQQIAVTMSSSGFDTFLVIIAPNGAFIEDDDGGGGTNSRIPAGSGFLTLGANGTYTIYATSFSPNVTGNYTLTLSGTGVLPTTVTNTNDGGFGSLRQAIINANANPGHDAITFQIGSGAQTITPATGLPALTDTVTIDGTTQPGFVGNPRIELNGANASFVPAGTPPPPGLNIMANNCVARGLVINRFNGGQISLFGSNCVIEGNYIDTDLSGATGFRSGGLGMAVFGNSNIIGGTTASARNIISGGVNGGIGFLGANNQLRGNFIGIGANGVTPTGGSGAGVGIIADISDGNVIGGTIAGARNIISGNEGTGVIIGFASGNLVQGNFIGTNAGGTSAVGNVVGGVSLLLEGTSGNTIGGTSVAARNTISGNSLAGVILGLGPSENLVQGNYLGTDAGGNVSISPNQVDGVFLANANRNTIGGVVAGARNVISGNSFAGIELYGGPTDVTPDGTSEGNRIQGNFIGTNAAGTGRVGDRQQDGISITIVSGSADNSIGGAAPEMRNIISGNNRNGVSIGIFINRAVPSLKPGGDTETPMGTGGRGILVQNNFIGTDVSGNNCLGNNSSGVFIDADSTTNTIRTNVIACNGFNGVTIPDNRNPGVRNEFDDNLIYQNAGLGIDLGNSGITQNDPLDMDGGANFQQNFPEPTSATLSVAPDQPDRSTSLDAATSVVAPIETNQAVTVNFTLPSTPNTEFTVHWYFSTAPQCSSNNTQSPTRPAVSGKLNARTDARGMAPVAISFAFPVGVTSGVVNCTATPVQGLEVGSTSEFSPCQIVNSSNAKRRRTGLGSRRRVR